MSESTKVLISSEATIIAEKTFNIGDEVASNTCPSLIGKIERLPRKGIAFVRVSEGKTLLVALPHWHKVNKED